MFSIFYFWRYLDDISSNYSHNSERKYAKIQIIDLIGWFYSVLPSVIPAVFKV